MVKIIQRRVKHAKVLPCVFFIPLRMRVRDNIIILYTEVDSKQIDLSQALYLKGIQRHAPQTLQVSFYSFDYHQSLFYRLQINNSFKFSLYALIHFSIISIASSR